MKEAEFILTRQVQTHQTPSVHYLIFDRQQVIDRFIYGQAIIGKGVPATMSTTYNAFSVTKTFTALAVLQLAEHNKLELEATLNTWFPELFFSSAITIKQLLSHTAGIANPIPLSWIHRVNEHLHFNSRLFFDLILAKNGKLKFQPGHKFAYSNLGYVLLGQLIERLSGLSYEEYIQRFIIDKLRLRPHALGFQIADPSKHANGYHRIMTFSYILLGLLIDRGKYMDKKEGKWRSFQPCYVNGPSYGGLIATPDAFRVYLQELLSPDSALIGEEFKKLLFTESYTTAGAATGMCLSWFKGQLNGRDYFAHAGGGGGYYCEIRLYPAAGIGSTIFYNRTGLKDERMLDRLDGVYLK